MTPQVLILLLATALSFAALDFLRKRLTEHVAVLPLLVILTLAALPFYVGWIVLESGDRDTFEAAGYLLPASISLALNVFANIAFLRAMQLSPLGLTIPLLSLTPVWSTLAAIPLLGEVPTPRQGVGITLTVVGALLLQFGAGRAAAGSQESTSFLRSMTREKGGLLMMAVALAWSLTSPFDKLALEHASVPLHALLLNLGVGLAAACFLVARGEIGEFSRLGAHRLMVLAAVLVSATALAVQFLALEKVFVGVLETTKRGFGSASAVALGVLFLGERVTVIQILAVVVMILGVALLL